MFFYLALKIIVKYLSVVGEFDWLIFAVGEHDQLNHRPLPIGGKHGKAHLHKPHVLPYRPAWRRARTGPPTSCHPRRAGPPSSQRAGAYKGGAARRQEAALLLGLGQEPLGNGRCAEIPPLFDGRVVAHQVFLQF